MRIISLLIDIAVVIYFVVATILLDATLLGVLSVAAVGVAFLLVYWLATG